MKIRYAVDICSLDKIAVEFVEIFDSKLQAQQYILNSKKPLSKDEYFEIVPIYYNEQGEEIGFGDVFPEEIFKAERTRAS